MRNRFHVTCDVVTPESAESGDVAEAGFLAPGEWRTNRGNPEAELSLRDALDLVAAGAMEDGGRSFYEIDARQDYRTGAEERRALHPPRGITPASYARIARLVEYHP